MSAAENDVRTTPRRNTYTHTRLTALCPGLPRVSRYQKGKTSLEFTEARDSEWQWHQLGHMQVCTSLQTDNHASTPPLSFYRPDVLPAAQPTASKHWRAGLNMNKFSCYLCANFRSLRRKHVRDNSSKPKRFAQILCIMPSDHVKLSAITNKDANSCSRNIHEYRMACEAVPRWCY